MLSAEARKRLSVVLVGARNPQNIGAAARAMRDFGFADLRVVNAFSPPFEAAQLEATSAVAADEIMRTARLFSGLADAIADCTVIIGTTAIGGRGLTRPVHRLADAADNMRQQLQPGDEGRFAGMRADSRVALLFGSEKTGLTNEQLSYCSTLITIPMFAPEGRHLSMNLGQSVAVCLYELVRDGFEGSRDLVQRVAPAPDIALRERLLETALELMERSGYTQKFPSNSRPAVVRQLCIQLGRTKDEAATWTGLFRHLLRSFEES